MKTGSLTDFGFDLKDPFHKVTAPPKKKPTRRLRPKRLSPVTLRLSVEERARLERDAGGQTLSAYVRSRLFGDHVTPRRKRRAAVADHAALGRVLAALGQSHLASNVNQLAKAVNTGTLPLGSDTEKSIRQACSDIAAIRNDLMVAIGISAE